MFAGSIKATRRASLKAQSQASRAAVDVPGLDGYDTCRQLKANPASAEFPAILHSARSSIDERLQGYAAGGADYPAQAPLVQVN